MSGLVGRHTPYIPYIPYIPSGVVYSMWHLIISHIAASSAPTHTPASNTAGQSIPNTSPSHSLRKAIRGKGKTGSGDNHLLANQKLVRDGLQYIQHTLCRDNDSNSDVGRDGYGYGLINMLWTAYTMELFNVRVVFIDPNQRECQIQSQCESEGQGRSHCRSRAQYSVREMLIRMSVVVVVAPHQHLHMHIHTTPSLLITSSSRILCLEWDCPTTCEIGLYLRYNQYLPIVVVVVVVVTIV